MAEHRLHAAPVSRNLTGAEALERRPGGTVEASSPGAGEGQQPQPRQRVDRRDIGRIARDEELDVRQLRQEREITCYLEGPETALAHLGDDGVTVGRVLDQPEAAGGRHLHTRSDLRMEPARLEGAHGSGREAGDPTSQSITNGIPSPG